MEEQSSEIKPNPSPFKNRKLAIISGFGILATVVLMFFVFFNLQRNPRVKEVKNQKLGASVSVTDGLVEFSDNRLNWSALKASDALQEGQYLRTNEASRSVVTLDDGTAIRINYASTIQLTDLSPNNIRITNLDGEVYTRVVKSDRKFSVLVGDESYVALGTAYKTINKAAAKGLEVYESSVVAEKAKQSIPEGKQYFEANTLPELTKQIADIPLEQMQKDPFIQWNLEQDKLATEFKNHLGHLKKLEASPAPIAAPTPAPESKPAPPPAPKPVVAVGGIKLSGSSVSNGINFSWTVTNVSVTNGFKLVKGNDPSPTFGVNEATYLSDSNLRSYTLSVKDGKTYHFRICTYTGSGCTNYSNNITVTAPYVAPPSPPTGTLTLSSTGATTLGWTLSGSAPYGVKLVWSPSTGPTYPASSSKFYSETNTTSATIDATTGTYYVRVCMYYEGTCLNYSNELTVTIP